MDRGVIEELMRAAGEGMPGTGYDGAYSSFVGLLATACLDEDEWSVGALDAAYDFVSANAGDACALGRMRWRLARAGSRGGAGGREDE